MSGGVPPEDPLNRRGHPPPPRGSGGEARRRNGGFSVRTGAARLVERADRAEDDPIRNRWTILLVLFAARCAMAFQFQSVAAVSPIMADAYGVSLAEIGFLIGLYLSPGVLIALPGGAVAARFGDKRVVGLGMVLMTVGAGLPLLAPAWDVLVLSRIMAGAGGVILNVVMTKMLVDWFQGREISTAMAIFVNSWPVGIALALFALPGIGEGGGLPAAWGAVLAVVAAGTVLFVVHYRPSPQAAAASAPAAWRTIPVYAVSLAGLIWGLYNGALAMVFGFAPAALVAAGWELTRAGFVVSLFMAAFTVSLPLGGFVADRTGRANTVILASLFGFAVLLPALALAPAGAVLALLLSMGVVTALAAGPIMALPSGVLAPGARAYGMGMFFTLYYVVMTVAPPIVGAMSDATGDAELPLWAGSVMCVAGIVLLGLFVRTRDPVAAGGQPG